MIHYVVNLGEQDPRKQGLKQAIEDLYCAGVILGEQDPRKQGLKPHITAEVGRSIRDSESKIQENKDWNGHIWKHWRLELWISESKIQENKDWNHMACNTSVWGQDSESKIQENKDWNGKRCLTISLDR